MKSKSNNFEIVLVQYIFLYIILGQWFFLNLLFKELSLFTISTSILLIIFCFINYNLFNNFIFYNFISDKNFTISYKDYLKLIENNKSLIVYYPIDNFIFRHIKKVIKNLFLNISILSIRYNNKIYFKNHLMFIINIILFNSFIFLITFLVSILKYRKEFNIIFFCAITIVYILYFFVIIKKININNILNNANILRKYNDITIYLNGKVYSVDDFLELYYHLIEESYNKFIEKIMQLLLPFSYIIYLTFFKICF